jgi:signal transduction histidine kinase
MDNGCKYSPDNKVDVRFSYSDKWIELIFEDRGIGIPAEDAERILEPFQRGANAISYTGTGIGLSLVNQIIKNHNGTLKISSQVGKGTIVIIMLPAIQ